MNGLHLVILHTIMTMLNNGLTEQAKVTLEEFIELMEKQNV